MGRFMTVDQIVAMRERERERALLPPPWYNTWRQELLIAAVFTCTPITGYIYGGWDLVVVILLGIVGIVAVATVLAVPLGVYRWRQDNKRRAADAKK